jgi:hypothetical protein
VLSAAFDMSTGHTGGTGVRNVTFCDTIVFPSAHCLDTVLSDTKRLKPHVTFCCLLEVVVGVVVMMMMMIIIIIIMQ